MNILGRASSIGTLALCYVYSAEVFPTVVRNVGIGSSSVWVSFIVLLGYVSKIISKYSKLIMQIINQNIINKLCFVGKSGPNPCTVCRRKWLLKRY